jgi:hypothetical protein
MENLFLTIHSKVKNKTNETFFITNYLNRNKRELSKLNNYCKSFNYNSPSPLLIVRLIKQSILFSLR